jgi:hypothetical protein
MSARSRSCVWLAALVLLASWGASASAAIDELEVIVDGGASSFPTPIAYGSAAQVAGQHWELTTAATTLTGGITYTDLPLEELWTITGEFWTGGGTGADAFYVYLWATSDPSGEDSANEQYTVAYDEFTDQIQLLHDGAVLAAVSEAGIDSSTWRTFQIDCNAGIFDIYLDGGLKLSYDDGMHFYGRAVGGNSGFGGRTADNTNEHRVRNMVLAANTSANTSALAVAINGGSFTYPTPTAFGGAVDGNAAWQLDTATAASHGGVTYSNLGLGERFDLTGEFRSGGGTGADIFYVYLWADTEPAWQSDTNGQYAISFDEFNDQIKLIYSSDTVAAVNDATLDNGQWRAFQISCDTGVFDVWLDGSLVFSYNDSANFFARSTGPLFGFAGGSGASTNAHQVRNMVAEVGATSTPSVVWSSPFTRQAFDGVADYTAIPDATIQSDTSLTAETWFRTNSSGVILGYQSDAAGGAVTSNYIPSLYVGTDGLLRGVIWSENVGANPITSAGAVTDGAWHHAALVADDDQSTLYLDGALVGVAGGTFDPFSQIYNQVGTGYTLSWPAGNGGWHYFGGEIASFNVWDGPLSTADVASAASVPPDVPAIAWSTSTGVVTTYDGVDDYTTATDDLIQSRVAMTVETWFRTTETRGGLFGYQDRAYPTSPVAGSIPSLYVASDGRLGGALYTAVNPPMFSPAAVNDGAWHHVALVGDVDRHHMYVDGAAVGTYVGAVNGLDMIYNQVGLAMSNWSGGAGSWDFFRGDIADFNIWDGTLDAADVASIAATPPTASVANLTGAFSGGADYVDIAADASLALAEEYTLEAWIRPTGVNMGQGTIVVREGEYLLAWWPSTTRIYYALGNNLYQWRDTGYSTPIGEWRHLALVYSNAAGVVRLYADGVEVYSTAAAGAMIDYSGASNDTRIGYRQDIAEGFRGDIDEARIWNVARSVAEIRSTYPRTLSPAEAVAAPGLVGYWNFDDGTAADLSASGNDGAFVGNSSALGSQQTFAVNGAAPVANSSAVTVANGPENYITITGSDADGDALTFYLSTAASDTMGLPLMLLDEDTADNVATVLYTPTADGSDSFSFTVTDGIETTAPATVGITVTAPTNHGAAFDGSADYIDVGVDPSLLLTGDFTLEAWIYPTGPGSGGAGSGGSIICREGEYILARWQDSSIRYATGNDGWAWKYTGFEAPQDEWTHVAFTHSTDDGMLRVYANGEEAFAVAAVSPTVTDYLTGWNNVWIGGRQSGEATFAGEIDEVRIWTSRARRPRSPAPTPGRSRLLRRRLSTVSWATGRSMTRRRTT